MSTNKSTVLINVRIIISDSLSAATGEETFELVSSACTPLCPISNNSVNVYILNTLHQLHVLTVKDVKLHEGQPCITSNIINIMENSYKTYDEFQFCCVDIVSLFPNQRGLYQGEYFKGYRQWSTNCNRRR